MTNTTANNAAIAMLDTCANTKPIVAPHPGGREFSVSNICSVCWAISLFDRIFGILFLTSVIMASAVSGGIVWLSSETGGKPRARNSDDIRATRYAIGMPIMIGMLKYVRILL